MAKPTRINTPVGRAIYPRLGQPDTKYNAAGLFSVKLSVPADEVEDLREKLEEIRQTAWDELDAKSKKTHTLVEVFEDELNDEGDETGNVIIKAKLQNIVTPKGKEPFEQRPNLFDSANNPLNAEEVKVGSGSRLRLNCDVIPYAMASSKTVGVSLRLKNVQVVELVEFGGASPFGEFEGGDVIESKPSESKPFEGGDDDEAGDDY